MDKKDDYQADFNEDEKKDMAPLRTEEVKAADEKHGAYRPRMNTVFNKEADTQFKEGNGSEDTADEED